MKKSEMKKLEKQLESWEKKLLDIKAHYPDNGKVQKEVEILWVQKDEMRDLLNSSVWDDDGLEDIEETLSQFKKSFEKLIQRTKGKKI